jgi:hypothetical protein
MYKKQDPPLQEAQGWATLRVFMLFCCVELCDLSVENSKLELNQGQTRGKIETGISDRDKRQDLPLQKAQGWGALRVFTILIV